MSESNGSAQGLSIGLLRAYLPERDAADVMAGLIPVVLGSQQISLPVLPIRPEREWLTELHVRMAEVWDGLDSQGDAAAVFRYLSSFGPIQRALLRAYDRDALLPSDEWLDDNATSIQVLRAFLAVVAATHPLAESVIDTLLRNPDLTATLLPEIRKALSGSTNGVQPATAGKPAKSRKS